MDRLVVLFRLPRQHLLPPKAQEDADKGIGGELWAVHGGGFYVVRKFKVAPQALPEPLHWFKWEAYTTWMQRLRAARGHVLPACRRYMIDPSVADISPRRRSG